MLRGGMVALTTPFAPDGTVDIRALRAHVEWLVAGGGDGLMPCGTTGEGALLSEGEVAVVVETAVEAAAGAIPVIAHVGRPGTEATRRLPGAPPRPAAGGPPRRLPAHPPPPPG